MTQLPSEARDKTPEEIAACCDGQYTYPLGYDPREELWRDVVRTGLAQLVAVDEVLEAARKVLSEYDMLFGLGFPEPEVPESFYTHDPHAETSY